MGKWFVLAAGTASFATGRLLRAARLVVHETDRAIEFGGDFGEAHIDLGHSAIVLGGAALEFLDEALMAANGSFVLLHATVVIDGVFGESALLIENQLRGFSDDFNHATIVFGHQPVMLRKTTRMVGSVAFLDVEM